MISAFSRSSFHLRHLPIQQSCPMTKVHRDRPMRSDQLTGPGQGLTLHAHQNRVGPEIAQGWRPRMPCRRFVQSPLQFLKRPPLHQDIKSPPTQHAHLPKMGKEVLGNHEMTALRRKIFPVMLRQLTIRFQESFLPNRALCRKSALPERTQQSRKGGMMPLRFLRNLPGIVPLFKTTALHRSEPVIALPRMTATPFVKLRPPGIE